MNVNKFGKECFDASGKRYSSIKSMAASLGISPTTIRKLISKDGKFDLSNKCLNSESKPVIFNGVRYSSINQLANAIGRANTTISKYLMAHNTNEYKTFYPHRMAGSVNADTPVIFDGVQYPSILELAEDLGLTKLAVRRYTRSIIKYLIENNTTEYKRSKGYDTNEARGERSLQNNAPNITICEPLQPRKQDLIRDYTRHPKRVIFDGVLYFSIGQLARHLRVSVSVIANYLIKHNTSEYKRPEYPRKRTLVAKDEPAIGNADDLLRNKMYKSAMMSNNSYRLVGWIK